MGVRAPLGGEHDEAVAVGLVAQRVEAFLAGLGAGGVEDDHRPALEAAPDPAFVGPELLDDLDVLLVPLVQLGHRWVPSSTSSVAVCPTTRRGRA